jgi:hypothetical protein
MFHWICPECGQEIAPGVKECPVCEPTTTTALAPDVPSAVFNLEPPALAAVVAAVEPTVEPSAILHPEVVVGPGVLQPKAFAGAPPPVILDAVPIEARPIVMPGVPLSAAVPLELPDALLDPPVSGHVEPETFADRLADLADLLQGERIPYSAPRMFQESAAPGPRSNAENTPLVVDVTFHAHEAINGTPARALLAAPPTPLLLAEPQPPAVAQELPLGAFDPCTSASATSAPAEAEPCAPAPVRLPDAPNRLAAPVLARFQSYHEAAGRLMRPANFVTQTAPPSALPKITLPGPALPRELMSLQAAGLVPLRTGMRQGPSSRFGWLTYAVMGIMLTAGVATFSMIPRTSPSAPPRPAPEPAPDPPVSARSTNSLARLVEVTGIRFMEVNKRPQIHYLVVNHSSAPMASVTVYVTLRAANAKAGQPPIARLNFRSPALQAFEAKEMFSSIERASAPLDLPDWQDLHADVEVQ